MDMDMSRMPTGRGFQPFPFGQCQVCEAEATGNHYGANTCEGCKGFFKRSLPVFRTFRCFFGNKCDVAPETRNRCKACRFGKCIDAGMALDAVKMGRIPKAVKEHAIEKTAKPPRHNTRINSQHSTSSSDNAARNSDQVSQFSPGGMSSPGSTESSELTGEGSVIRTAGKVSAVSQHNDWNNNDLNSGLTSDAASKSPLNHSPSGNYRFHPYADQDQRGQDNRASTSASRNQAIAFTKSAPGHSHFTPGKSGNAQSGQLKRQIDEWQNNSQKLNDTDQTAGQLKWSGVTSFAGDGQSNSAAEGREDVNNRSAYEMPHKVFKSSEMMAGKYMETHAPSPRMKAMADMAITGDLNENEPNLPIPCSQKIKVAMATSVTAVAVLDPTLRGGNHCMPVVPGDIMVFQPTFVPVEKLPDSSDHDISHTKLNSKHRDFIPNAPGANSSRIQYHIPASPTLSYFMSISHNMDLKLAMCENTSRIIAQKNNEIYGVETRANDVFLKEALLAGSVPEGHPERSPEQMRDILKDRLITQVKRVILLGENIPGFHNLDTTDQHFLLRTCILDIWMVHSARFLRDKQSYIIFLESNTYYARHWMEMFLTDEFLETVFEIANRINSLDLSFDELALLKSVLIVRPDRPSLRDVEFITVLHNHLLDSLKTAVRRRRPLESAQLLDDLLELLKDWRILDDMQEKYVHPIDLSHFSKGPWKVESSGGSVSSASSQCGVDVGKRGISSET